MAKFDGNTHVGYFTEKGCFCLDCINDESYGHTDEELEQGIENGDIEQVMDMDYNSSETCKVCGYNLIEKAFAESLFTDRSAAPAFSYQYDETAKKFWILENGKHYAPKGRKWFAKSEGAAQEYVKELSKEQ